MFDDLKAYFIENILVLYKDYLKTKKSIKFGLSNDLRTAINLSTSLYHLREHIPIEIRKTSNEFKAICPDYNLLGDIVNASKHGILTKKNPKPLISNAKNIYECVVGTLYVDKDGEYNHMEKAVFVRFDDGTERDLHGIIINVMNMWISELTELNILNNFSLLQLPYSKIPRRTKKSGIINLTAKRDLRFAPKFKVQKYNYEKGIIVPVNLTEGDLVMRVYKKPSHIISLTATKDGQDIIIEIEVDDIELEKYNALEKEEEKIHFFLNKAKEQGKIK